jgi:hypothetical protein
MTYINIFNGLIFKQIEGRSTSSIIIIKKSLKSKI